MKTRYVLPFLFALGCGGVDEAQAPLDAGPQAGTRCPPSGPKLAALPYEGSLYMPENFELFIQAFGADPSTLQVAHRDGTPVAASDIQTIAPGIFQIHPTDVGCVSGPSAGCLLDITWAGETISVGGNVHPFGGVDTTPPQLDAQLQLTNPELDPSCPRPVVMRAQMSSGSSPPFTNDQPQSANPVHVVEMEDGAGGWIPVGGVVEFGHPLEFDVYVDRGVGRRCFRAVSIDSAGHVTRDDANPVCLDPGF